MCHDIEWNSPGGLAYDLVLNKSAGLATAEPIIPARAPEANFFHIGEPLISAPIAVLIGS